MLTNPLEVDHYIRLQSIYRRLRRECPDTIGHLPRSMGWFVVRYLNRSAITRLASARFSDPPVISIHRAAFDYDGPALLRGLFHHELCHLIAGPQAGHGPEFERIERAWGDLDIYRANRNRFARELHAAGNDEQTFVYECANCGGRVVRRQQIQPGSSCKSCCKQFNEGKWSAAYPLIRAGSVG